MPETNALLVVIINTQTGPQNLTISTATDTNPVMIFSCVQMIKLICLDMQWLSTQMYAGQIRLPVYVPICDVQV